MEDRFAKAMERSQRNKGYMRDLAEKMGSRNASVEPTARSTKGGDGALFKSGLFMSNASEIRMKG